MFDTIKIDDWIGFFVNLPVLFRCKFTLWINERNEFRQDVNNRLSFAQIVKIERSGNTKTKSEIQETEFVRNGSCLIKKRKPDQLSLQSSIEVRKMCSSLMAEDRKWTCDLVVYYNEIVHCFEKGMRKLSTKKANEKNT